LGKLDSDGHSSLSQAFVNCRPKKFFYNWAQWPEHYGIQHNDIQHNETQHNGTLCRVLFNVIYAECHK
jgi:hypothetical protein